jgi:hypothetical protein
VDGPVEGGVIAERGVVEGGRPAEPGAKEGGGSGERGGEEVVFSYDAGTTDDTIQITVGGDLAGPRPDRRSTPPTSSPGTPPQRR